jgi:hypothetical protein
VLIEVDFKVGSREGRTTLSDFEIDPRIDDALFRLEPPPGYTLRTAEADSPEGGPEAALVRLLRAYAERSGGTFPPRLDDWEAYDKQFPKEAFKGVTDPNLHRFSQAVAGVQLFLLDRKAEGGYGYRADDVRLGDINKVLLWYRPKGSATYRAIFGDLHASDVPADQLPEPPKP